MKQLIVIATALLLFATPVSAETVRTCSSVYGGGEVCGETTTTTVTHTVVQTGAGGNMLMILAGVAGTALFMTLLYKLTYKSYLLG